MPLRRLSVSDECRDVWTCPSVWEDTDNPDKLVIVGHPAPPGTVEMAEGEIALVIDRKVVADAHICSEHQDRS